MRPTTGDGSVWRAFWTISRTPRVSMRKNWEPEEAPTCLYQIAKSDDGKELARLRILWNA
jgi:hypothetical protein